MFLVTTATVVHAAATDAQASAAPLVNTAPSASESPSVAQVARGGTSIAAGNDAARPRPMTEAEREERESLATTRPISLGFGGMILIPTQLRGSVTLALDERFSIAVTSSWILRELLVNSETWTAGALVRWFPFEAMGYFSLGGAFRHTAGHPGGFLSLLGPGSEPPTDSSTPAPSGGRGNDLAVTYGFGLEWRFSRFIARLEPLAFESALVGLGDVERFYADTPADPAWFRRDMRFLYAPSAELAVRF